MAGERIVVPREWEEISRAPLRGLVMVVGASDTGKSTFAHWLLEQLSSRSSVPLAFLDGDPGQSALGPPTTVTLALVKTGMACFPGSGRRWRRFIGSTTPRHHELELLVGINSLVEAARGRRIKTIVYDTTGLIDRRQGGVALKLAKIDLLRPDFVVAFRRGQELEPLLAPLRRVKRTRVVELDPAPDVRPRSMGARQCHRSRRFAEHFAPAAMLEVDRSQVAVFPDEVPEHNQLLAFEDSAGFVLALGIAAEPCGNAQTTRVLTPLRDPLRVAAIRLADLVLDPVTFQDRPKSTYRSVAGE